MRCGDAAVVVLGTLEMAELWSSAGPASRAFTGPGAQMPALPSGFTTTRIATPGGELFVQAGGSGPAVVLLHGYVQSGDMWGPLAARLREQHTVIVPDLRGLGRSSRPVRGYDKKTQARDVHAVVETLGFDRAAVVGHDLGGMVAYAYAAQYRAEVSRLVVMEAAPPGVPPWSTIASMPGVWHFHFRGPEAERLVEGRERIYFERFWNEFAADPSKIGDAIRDHYAKQYAEPGAMRAGFEQFAAFDQDVRDNQEFRSNKLTIPVLAAGGACADRAFSAVTAAAMREVAADVREAIIPGAGHWLLEENPAAALKAVCDFLET